MKSVELSALKYQTYSNPVATHFKIFVMFMFSMLLF